MTADTPKEYGSLSGTASDAAPDILATGDSGISTLFLSLAERHPEGKDPDYLRWHSLDHRPEQHRLAALKASLRAVSTPACRAARAADDARFQATDHLISYFFSDYSGFDGFNALSAALRNAGRSPFILPPVQRGVFSITGRCAAERSKAGADVLPWRPTLGIYLLIEKVDAPVAVDSLTSVNGVAGVWTARADDTPLSSLAPGLQLSYCFLDEDPIETALRLKPVLKTRWQEHAISALFAAPFYTVIPFEWARHLP